MRIRNAVTALAALSLVSAPVVAQAAPAEVEQARVSSEVKGESLRGGFLIPFVVLIAAVLGVLLATSSGNEPVSP